MHCPSCRRAMISTSSREFQDEKGAMTVTRWRCRPCHETAEEIWLSAGYCGLGPTTIRYTVAPEGDRPRPIRSVGGRRKGTLVHAGTC